MSDRTIFVATDSIHGEFEGRPLYLHRGVTTARVGHPVLAAFADHFAPLRPTFEVDDEPEGEAETEDVTPEREPPGEQVGMPEPKPADVRAWATEQGIDAPARGKVPTEVVDAYKAAHAEA